MQQNGDFNRALFECSPVETIVVDREGRVVMYNRAKRESGDRLPAPGDVMYREYAGRHETNMHAELMRCIRTAASRCFPEQKYGDKTLCITISPFSGGAIIVNEDITKRKRAEDGLRENLERFRRTAEGVVDAMGTIVETRDPYTSGHQNRVAALATTIARQLEISPEAFEATRFAALIHDIGKIAIPSELLSYPERLSPVQFSIIKTHPKVGYDILKPVNLPWPIADIIIQHHERINGSGYPFGRDDGDIRLEARIIAVADVVEAMSSHRPYRPALGIPAALREISDNRGTLYDPAVADACAQVFRRDNFRFA